MLLSKKNPVLLLIGGSLIGQLVTVVGWLILSRVYTPESFGVLAAVVAPASVIAVVAHGRYHTALPLATTTKNATALLTLAVLASGATCTLFFIISSFIPVWGGELSESKYVMYIAGVAALYSLSLSVGDVLSFEASRRNLTEIAAGFRYRRPLITVFCQFCFFFLCDLGLLAGLFFGSLVSVVLLWTSVKPLFSRIDNAVSWRRMCLVANRNRHLLLFATPQGLLASASWNGLAIVVNYAGGLSAAGHFWFAYRLVLSPISLIGNAYRQGTIGRYKDVERLGDNQELRLLLRDTLILTSLASCAAGAIVVFSTSIFGTILDNSWNVMPQYLTALSFGLIGDMSKIPMQTRQLATGKTRNSLIQEFTATTFKYSVLLLSIFVFEFTIVKGILLFSIVGSTIWLLLVVCYYFDVVK